MTVEHCAQMDTTEHLIESSSGRSNYRVRLFLMTDEPSTCNCTAFAINRNRAGGKNHGGIGHCKHIDQVMAKVCQWRLGDEDQRIPGLCPRCFGPTSDAATDEVIPETRKQSEAHAVDGLLAMVERLGIELELEDS